VKYMRLIMGIITVGISGFIAWQYNIVEFVNNYIQAGVIGRSAGLLFAVCMFVAGLLAMLFRKRKLGTIISACFYNFGGAICILNFGVYPALMIWYILSFTFGLIFTLTAIWQNGDPLY